MCSIMLQMHRDEIEHVSVNLPGGRSQRIERHLAVVLYRWRWLRLSPGEGDAHSADHRWGSLHSTSRVPANKQGLNHEFDMGRGRGDG